MTDADDPKTSEGVGARLPRKEDERLMRGLGQYVGDIRWPACRTWPSSAARWRMPAFAPSTSPKPFATGFSPPRTSRASRPIGADSGLPGFKSSAQPVLAADKVRHVGELIAMCVAPTRAEAEDLAGRGLVDFDELPAVADMRAARQPGSRTRARALG